VLRDDTALFGYPKGEASGGKANFVSYRRRLQAHRPLVRLNFLLVGSRSIL
jgi:hypothetical protein